MMTEVFEMVSPIEAWAAPSENYEEPVVCLQEFKTILK